MSVAAIGALILAFAIVVAVSMGAIEAFLSQQMRWSIL